MPVTLVQDAAMPPHTTQQARKKAWARRAKPLKCSAAIIAAVILTAYVATGLRYTAYSPQRSDAYLWCVYHVHSNLSDGLQSPEEIAQQARAAGISLVLLTDHGRPNIASSIFRDTIDGVTIVGGSEATLPDGHFTFFGARQAPGFRVSSFPPEAMQDARSWDAFPVLAYPDDRHYGWHYWNADLRPGGIEILNLFTSLRRTSLPERLQLALFYPFSRYYFLKTISFPSESIAHWDEFLQHDRTWGFVASDAHGGFHITKLLAIKMPSYTDTFSFVAMGIDKRYSRDPEVAIRKGDFFNCIRGAAEPEKFDFSAQSGAQFFPTGSDAPEYSTLHVAAHAESQTIRLVLKKNGAEISEATADHLDLQNAPTGVYRIEAYLLHHPLLRADVPWIISNPIFVGIARGSARPATTQIAHAVLSKRADAYKR
jgi:PHP domain